jgi:hypothetical protein
MEISYSKDEYKMNSENGFIVFSLDQLMSVLDDIKLISGCTYYLHPVKLLPGSVCYKAKKYTRVDCIYLEKGIDVFSKEMLIIYPDIDYTCYSYITKCIQCDRAWIFFFIKLKGKHHFMFGGISYTECIDVGVAYRSMDVICRLREYSAPHYGHFLENYYLSCGKNNFLDLIDYFERIDNYDSILIMGAVEGGHVKFLSHIMNKIVGEFDINRVLNKAFEMGNLDVVKCLMEHRMVIFTQTDLFNRAMETPNTAILDYLYDKGYRQTIYIGSEALNVGQTDNIDWLNRKGINVVYDDIDGEIMCDEGCLEKSARYITSNKVELDSADYREIIRSLLSTIQKLRE